MQRVKEFKDLELRYRHSVGTLTVQVWTDMDLTTGAPEALAVQKTLEFPATSGTTQATHTLPLDGLFGTIYRVRVVPEAGEITQLFGGIIRARPIGVYLIGTNGEVWDSGEQGIGI